MYKLPKGINLGFFEQQELTDIGIGKYAVILNFSSKVTLTIQSRFTSSAAEESPSGEGEMPLSAKILLPFIGASIVETKGDEDGTLQLKFSNGESLFVYDDDPSYESYVITKDGETIIVV